jgi:hypothetical protein
MEQRLPDVPLPPDWERRKAERVRKNEAAFKAHNERRKAFEQDFADPDEPIPFACECGDVSCYDPIQLTIPQFDNAHAQQRRYVVKPLHVMPDYERVVEEHDAHWVVEKYPPGDAPAEAVAMAASATGLQGLDS